MKKLFILLLVLICITTVLAKSKFVVNRDNILTNLSSSSDEIISKLNDNYMVTYNKTEENTSDNITSLVKRTTYLLLGNPNATNITYEEYASRKKELSELRYSPNIPVDDNQEIITNSDEYQDDLYTAIVIPEALKSLSEKDITYSSIGNIKIYNTNKYLITRTALNGVTIQKENSINPKKLDTVSTGLVLTYFYKQYNNEYKLYHVDVELSDDVEEYFSSIETNEDNNRLASNSKFIPQIAQVVDYQNLTNLSEDKIKTIFNNNKNNVFLLNTYYNNTQISSAMGTLISDGIILTSYSYLEEAILDGQHIIISDINNKAYSFDGIITASKEYDIALIKLKEKIKTTIKWGNTNSINENDPVIMVGSKTGLYLSTTAGIVFSKTNGINSFLPVAISDLGSPLFNSSGELIAINVGSFTNSNIVSSLELDKIIDIKATLENTSFNNIKYTTFDELKNTIYKSKSNEELEYNNIPSSIWKEFKKIGNIENTINISPIKSSYYDDIVSIRYYNNVNNIIGNFDVASSFIGKLKDSNYLNTYSDNNKIIYESENYEVILKSQFNYLIVIMVKK